MLQELCNQLRIRMGQYTHKRLGIVAEWLAAKAGLKVVDADATLLPGGCRAIPKHHYNVDPVVLNQLKDGNRAILHQAMKNWQVSNEQTGKHWFKKDDQWGTKGDPKTWHKQVFPFLTLRTVKAMIADLVEASLVVVDGAWCQSLKAEFSGAEQMLLPLGKDFQQPRKVFHSSIRTESNSLKNKTGNQTSISPRKDAVADFPIPETLNKADLEIHESRDGDVEGCDILHELPGALVTAWTDTKMPLEEFVARYGAGRINATWPTVQDFKNPIAGLRTVLAKSPTPRFASPPSIADEPTEPDWVDEDETPDIDARRFAPVPISDEDNRQAWLKAHVAPALLANGGVKW